MEARLFPYHSSSVESLEKSIYLVNVMFAELKRALIHFFVAGLILVMAGCQKQGPVELIDEEIASNDLEVLNIPPPSLNGLDGSDVDSTLPSLITERAFGQLVIAGSLVESATERHETILARGVFYMRNAPVVRGADTLYSSADVGDLDVDGIRLSKVMKFAPRNRLDTLGIQYVLGGRDGVGGRGLQYFPGHAYEWVCSGAGEVTPFSITVNAADTLRITSPSVNDAISIRRNLTLSWSGGSSPIVIVISDLRSTGKPVPLFRFRTRGNRGKATIPATVLQLLPRGRGQFLFSLVSEKHHRVSVGGFGDDVLVQTAYSHNLILRVTR